MTSTADRAISIVAVAIEEARGRGLDVSVAVVDAGGSLLAFGRSANARPYTVEVAQSKAYGVVFTGRTSAELRDMAEARPQFFGALKNLGQRTLVPSPGGIAIPGGGAIGVSGAPNPDQDVSIAEASLAATDSPVAHETA
jgi:uncharacterized protein GlcG (DUF336 family)